MISADGENVIEMFDGWLKQYTEVSNRLADMEENNKKSIMQIDTLTRANMRLHTECSMLQETVSQCQQQLYIMCDLEDKVQQLKLQIAEKDQAMEIEHAQSKALIENIKENHDIEKELILTNIKAEYDRKFADVENQLRVEVEAKNSLQSHLEDIKKEKDKEVSRITLEYESKLTKAHRQKAQYIQHQQQIINQDVMRKKMQHMKGNYEQEIATLKAEIEDMKLMLESVHHEKEVKEDHIQLNEQQPKQLHFQEQKQQQRRGHMAHPDMKNASKFRSTSGMIFRL